MSSPPAQHVTNVYVLVHPFYSFWPAPGTISDFRRVFKYLSGVWGNIIRQAADDPEGLLIIVKDASPDASRVFELGKASSPSYWFMKQILRLFSFARKKMSSRLIEVSNQVDIPALRRELFSRGMVFSRHSTRITGFGEWLEFCVNHQTKEVAHAFRAPLNNVTLNRRASVSSIIPFSIPKLSSDGPIGNYSTINYWLNRQQTRKRRILARQKKRI